MDIPAVGIFIIFWKHNLLFQYVSIQSEPDWVFGYSFNNSISHSTSSLYGTWYKSGHGHCLATWVLVISHHKS